MAQEFWQSSQPHRSQWYCFWRLETFSFVMVIAVFSGRNTGAIAFSLNEPLPHNSTSLAQNPLPPLTLPPAVFPTNQPPAVSVPTLQQPIPSATPIQLPEPLPQNVAPSNSSLVIEFGQPLPEATTSTPASTPQSTIPTLEPAITNLNP